MKLTVLISTMDDGIRSLCGRISSIPKHVDILICHQVTRDPHEYTALVQELEERRSNLKVVQRFEVGLARSRNWLLHQVSEGICLISDDDVEYAEGFFERIVEAYRKYPNADIITFQVQTPLGMSYKPYEVESRRHNLLSAGKVSSIEITFRADSARRAKVEFDKRFGLGSTYPTGEEYVFLTDCIKAGLRAYYCPSVITIHPEGSSGKAFCDEVFVARGAMFSRIFGFGGYLIMLAFAVRKRRVYRGVYTPFRMFLLQLKGGREFRRQYKQ